jgi:AraC-like DNA-binding protein
VFSALNYFRPQQTYYRVRMKGLDDEWRILSPYSDDGMVDENGLLHLPLMGIQPGEYELEVQASMSLNDWETKPYVWKITIHEPWWRTTGVFALFGLVLAVLLLINIYYYMKNATLKAMRNSEETMLIKRIYNFVERIDSKEDVLEPSPEEYTQATLDNQYDLDPAFIKAIDKIAPVVEMERKQKKMTMRRLSNAAGVGGKEFYAMITANIFKSPRVLIKRNRLAQAERMLRNTKAPIDEVAKECGFVSANYFIASFYQKYKTTPQQYRQKR